MLDNLKRKHNKCADVVQSTTKAYTRKHTDTHNQNIENSDHNDGNSYPISTYISDTLVKTRIQRGHTSHILIV